MEERSCLFCQHKKARYEEPDYWKEYNKHYRRQAAAKRKAVQKCKI